MTWRVAVGTTLFFLSSPTISIAQESDIHCSVIGQMAMSTWVEMLSSLGTDTDKPISDSLIGRLDHLTGIYGQTDCDIEKLSSAMSCVISDAGTGTSRAVAKACIDKSNLGLP